MEHTMTERFTERLAEKLAQPTFDPHGDPIPGADGTLPQRVGEPLTNLTVGEKLNVNRILSQESEVLTYLFDLGVKPGVVLTVEGVEPFGKLFYVSSATGQFALSADLAENVEGEK